MIYDIQAAKELGADGLVFGCLRPDGSVDMEAMKVLMEAAGDTPVTFHRAFDHTSDPFKALEDIISLGCARILTSGCRPTALEGAELLAQLVEKAAGRIIIMPGCGVNPNNIRQIAEETGASEFHFSGRSSYESEMIFRNPKVSMGGTVKIEEYQRDITNPEIVKAALAELAAKDEKDAELEKKEKETRSKTKKKKDEFDDEEEN
jgi:copper homeostasis protein